MIHPGEKYSKLTVLDTHMERVSTGGTQRFATVQCDCEDETILENVNGGALRYGRTRSCGCIGRGPRKGSKGTTNRKRTS
mgnify:FL=1